MNADILSRLAKLWRSSALGSAVVFAGVVLVTALLATLAVGKISLLSDAERYVQDQEMAVGQEPQDPDIVIVAINEDTLKLFPYRSPVDRLFVSNLLKALAAKHPRAIGVDLLFDQSTETAKDDALRETLRTLPVPLTVSYVDDGDIENVGQKSFLDGFVPSPARAFATLITDRQDTVRSIYPGAKTRDGQYIPGFARALAALVGVKTPAIAIPVIWHGQAELKAPVFKEYPAQVASVFPEAWFKNKIVLIGSDLTLVDRHRTPLATAKSDTEGMLPGVVIQAHELAQLIHHVKSPFVGWWVNFFIAIGCACVGAALGSLNVALHWRAIAGVAFIVVLWYAGWTLTVEANRIVDLIAPTLAAIAAFGGMDSLAGRDARRQREFIQGAFSRYVSPKVVEQLVRDPERMALDGERRVMTYIFTDVKNFTTMSEGMDSKELARILNAYLDGITRIVLKHNGMVDKFIGDAVFAIFNAPVDLPDHAEHAVRCALEIDDFCKAFSDEQYAAGIPFGITRIGVHTGMAVIGNFGSHARFTYTAQGDAVNTASRLEGLNKYFGTRICVSDATRLLCRTIRFRPIASVVMKGKTLAIEVWEPLHDGDHGDDFLARYESAYAALKQDLPEALALFTALKEETPQDPCVALHVGRIGAGELGVAMVMAEK